MKKHVLVLGIICVTLFVLVQSGVIDALLIFLLSGAIPGTTWSLPAGLMLVGWVATALILTFRWTAIALISELDLRRRTAKYLARKDRMPKKRFRPL